MSSFLLPLYIQHIVNLFLVGPTIKESVALRSGANHWAVWPVIWHTKPLYTWVTMKRGYSNMVDMTSGTISVPQQTAQLACHCRPSSAWKLFHRHGYTAFFRMKCFCTLPQSENDLEPCFAVSAAFCALYWQDCVSIKYWNWQVLDNLNQASCIFQTHPYLSVGRGSSVSFLGWEQLLSIGVFTSSSVEGNI